MRVRLRKAIFERLQQTAEEETALTGEHVTVSDIVRSACYNYLLAHESLRRIELPQDQIDELVVMIDLNPMLG